MDQLQSLEFRVTSIIWRPGLPVNSLGVAPLHLEAGGYLWVTWELHHFIWRPVITCEFLGSGSPLFGGRWLPVNSLGLAPLHLEAGGFLQIPWEWLTFIWRPVVTCKSLCSGSLPYEASSYLGLPFLWVLLDVSLNLGGQCKVSANSL